VEVSRRKLDFHFFTLDMDRIYLRCIEWAPAALDGINGFPLWFQTRHAEMRKRRMIPFDELVEHRCVGYGDFPINKSISLRVSEAYEFQVLVELIYDQFRLRCDRVH
jgi:hypothetical protein